MLLQGRFDRNGLRVESYEFLGAAGVADRARADPLRSGEDLPPGIHTTGMVPVHPAGEGLRPQKLREWIWRALR